jgi:hypothetical protein
VSRIGDNVHGSSLRNPEATLQHLQRRRPRWTLVMDNVDFARELKRRVPSCNVIFRAWPDDDLVRTVDAETWVLQTKARIGSSDLWSYAGNEPGWSAYIARTARAAVARTFRATSARTHALAQRAPAIDNRALDRILAPFRRLFVWLLGIITRAALGIAVTAESQQAISVVRWNIEVIKAARKHGLKVVVGNFSSGTPNPDDWKHPLALEFLRLLNECRAFAVLGLHEYACGVITSGFIGGWPQFIRPDDWPQDVRGMTLWHVGRYKFVIAACEAAGIPAPRIVVTEFGFDDMSDLKQWAELLRKTPPYTSIRGWRSLVEQWREWYGALGWTDEDTLYESVDYAERVPYYHPAVECILILCEGASSPIWEQFNKELAFHFKARLEQRENTEPMPSIPQPPEPGDYIFHRGPGQSNGRETPGLQGTPVTTIGDGARIHVTDEKPREADGYTWIQVIANGYLVWLALLAGMSFEAVQSNPPPPDPPKPPNLTKADAERIETHLRAIGAQFTELADVWNEYKSRFE